MAIEDMMKPVAGVEPLQSGVYLWRYRPSLGAAVTFLLLFLVASLHISWKIWRARARFCWVFAIGNFVQTIGYGVRASAHNNTGKVMPYCIQNVFILIAPVLYAATIYMILGRVINHSGGTQYSPIRPSRITWTFITGDIVSFMVQGGGAGLSVIQNATLAKWSERIVVIGLFIQIIMFTVFCLIAAVFHGRMRNTKSEGAANAETTFTSNRKWEADLYLLYALSLFILARSVFRVVEYCQGHTGYALSHEWTLYVFDALPMVAAAALFSWRLPDHLGPSGAVGGVVSVRGWLLHKV